MGLGLVSRAYMLCMAAVLLIRLWHWPLLIKELAIQRITESEHVGNTVKRIYALQYLAAVAVDVVMPKNTAQLIRVAQESVDAVECIEVSTESCRGY